MADGVKDGMAHELGSSDRAIHDPSRKQALVRVGLQGNLQPKSLSRCHLGKDHLLWPWQNGWACFRFRDCQGKTLLLLLLLTFACQQLFSNLPKVTYLLLLLAILISPGALRADPLLPYRAQSRCFSTFHLTIEPWTRVFLHLVQ